MKCPRPFVVLVACLILQTLVCCRASDRTTNESRKLAQTVIEGVRRNFDYRDFKFRLKITRTFANGAQYSKTFQFFGVIGDTESRVYAESTSSPPGESSRYLMLFQDRKLISAKMSSASMGEAEMGEDDGDLNKITFGNLSYPEFRHMISLRAEDVNGASEESGYFVLRSHIERPPRSDEFEESRAVRFNYYVDRQSYLPARIEFYNQREKFKEFELAAKEEIGGKWVVRSGKVKDFIDQSETLLEFDDVRLDEGVDRGVFDEQRLRARE